MAIYLRKDGSFFIWYGGYETKDLPKQAGFRWNPDKRQWWTSFVDNAAKLVNYAEPELAKELKQYSENKEKAIKDSRASSADIKVPAPEGLAYMPFQKAGINYALQRKNTLIGDEMGLGKTIQAIGVINATPSIRRVLVVAPASLKLNWQRELGKWLTRKLSVGVANGSFPDSDIVIANYDILKKHLDKITSIHWNLVIADECHYVKSESAQRTKILMGYTQKKQGVYEEIPGIVDKIDSKIFMTGTPILNRPIELWPIVHNLAPETFPNFMTYAKRYCAASQTGYGWDFSGASNLGELQEKLRSTIMVRRMKKDVLTELPSKTRQVVEIEAVGKTKQALKQEKETFAKHEANLAKLRVAVELAKASDDEDEYSSAVNALSSAAQIAFGDISKERHELALAKLPQVIDYIHDAVDSNGKVIVFAHHHDVVNGIMNAFPNEAVKLTGEESLEARQKAVDRFQNDPKIQLFVGSIKASGLGITLTASSHVIFAELDWVPGNVTQAEDRAHRIGQHDNVLVQHLVVDGSLDSQMAKTLVEKQEVIDKALDTQPPPPTPIEEPATMSISKKTLEKEAKEKPLPEAEVSEIHVKLKYLARVCDGAVVEDGVGFNKIDTGIGKSLAMSPALTQKQAMLGKIILRKYHRQLDESPGIEMREVPETKDLIRAGKSLGQAKKLVAKKKDNPPARLGAIK